MADIEIQKVQAGLRLLGYDTGNEFSGEMDAGTAALINQFIVDNDLSVEADDTEALLEAMSERVRNPEMLQRMAELAAQGADASAADIFTVQIGLLLNDIQSAFDGNFESLNAEGIGGFLETLATIFPSREDPNRHPGATVPGLEEMIPTPNIGGLMESGNRWRERLDKSRNGDTYEELERPPVIEEDPSPEMMAEAYIYHLVEEGTELTEEEITQLRSMVADFESTPITRETAADAIRSSRIENDRDIEHINGDLDYMNQQIALYRAQGMTEHEATIRGVQDLQGRTDARYGAENVIATPDTMIEAMIKRHAFNERHGPLTDEQRAELQELHPHGRMPSEGYTVLDYHARVITGEAYSSFARIDSERIARTELQPIDTEAEGYTPIPDYDRDPDEVARALEHQGERAGLDQEQREETRERRLEEAEAAREERETEREEAVERLRERIREAREAEAEEEVDDAEVEEEASLAPTELEETRTAETQIEGDIVSPIQLASAEWVAAGQAEGTALDVLAREQPAVEETVESEQTYGAHTFT